ncbi:hypothetical protein [Scytonema sp. NUACC21]
MGLPAFPTIGRALRTPPGAVGLTLSLFMLGFAIAQLGCRHRKCRLGRRALCTPAKPLLHQYRCSSC